MKIHTNLGEIIMKIGILGTGNIASQMARTINGMKEAVNYAVASRSLERAEDFKKKYEFAKAYGSYEELAADSEVELIYIATPHSEHYENAKLCLLNKKAVFVEKAFTVNEKQAAELIEIAKSRNVFITEAFWTRFMPMRKKLNEIIESGVIGEVTSLTANLGFPLEHVQRMSDPHLAGGALLDLGVYPINFASMVFGDKVKKITSSVIMTQAGVDAQNSITLTFEENRLAILQSNMTAKTDNRGVINGNKGFIVVENINNYEEIRVYDLSRQEIAVYERPEQISGYEYEVLASIKAIQEGKIECEEMPHIETLRIMRMMDDIRAEWCMKLPCED